MRDSDGANALGAVSSAIDGRRGNCVKTTATPTGPLGSYPHVEAAIAVVDNLPVGLRISVAHTIHGLVAHHLHDQRRVTTGICRRDAARDELHLMVGRPELRLADRQIDRGRLRILDSDDHLVRTRAAFPIIDSQLDGVSSEIKRDLRGRIAAWTVRFPNPIPMVSVAANVSG